MSADQLLATLSPEQEKPVFHPLGEPMLVLAGAGSGKTRVMTARVHHVLEQGAPPRSVVAITFTNKAADELRHRLGFGDDPKVGPRVSTIHSLALNAIRIDPRGFGLATSKVTPLDEGDQKDMLRRLIENRKKDPKFQDLDMWKLKEKMGYHRARGVGFAVDYTPEVHKLAEKAHRGYHALTEAEVILWRDYEEAKTCHPAGTLVTVVAEPSRQQNRIKGMIPARLESRPIEALQDGDLVVTWRRKDGRVLYRGRRITTASRHYRGDMLTLATASGQTTRLTPDHYMWVRFNEGIRGKYFVYLMYREGFGFRVGVSAFKRGAGSGISMRLYAEGGDCLWVLRICDSKFEAVTWEQVTSFKYGIPQTLWNPREERHKSLIQLVFAEADPAGGRRCLQDYHLLEEEPLIRRGVARCSSACMRFFKTAAANVIPGLMNTPAVTRPTWDGGRQHRWRIPEGVPVTQVTRQRYDGQVFSLDVEEDHTYLADGIVVANCASVVDFDDMLHLVVRRGQLDDAWRSGIQRQFRHVLMDEAQDTNAVQWAFVEMLLAPDNRSLCAVGDLSQSIYAFSGASPDILESMVHGWRGVVPVTYKLEDNYRSLGKVVRFANRIQKTMTGTVPLQMNVKRLEAEGYEGAVTLIREGTDRDIAERIAETIARDARLKTGKFKFRDNAILVRSASQIPALEDALVRCRIPYIVRGGQGLFQTEEARDLFAYLKLVVNPSDVMAFKRAVGTPKRGLGDVAVEKLQKTALAKFEGDLVKAAQNSDHMVLRPFGDFIGDLGRFENPVDALHKLISRIDYRGLIRDRYKKNPEAQERKLENLDRILEAIKGLVESSPNGTASFADIIFRVTMDSKAEAASDDGVVVISTIHNAKGLEWPRVYVTNIYEGSLPHQWSSSEKEVEEERRLFYVAVTRARDVCGLCVPTTVSRGPNVVRVQPSRFLVELGIIQ